MDMCLQGKDVKNNLRCEKLIIYFLFAILAMLTALPNGKNSKQVQFKKCFILLHHYLFTNEEFKNTALLYLKAKGFHPFQKSRPKFCLKTEF